MRIPIGEVQDFLNTHEMYDIIQTALNDGEMVEHEIIGGTHKLSITAHHNCDLDIRWDVFKNFAVLHDDVATVNLGSTLSYVDK